MNDLMNEMINLGGNHLWIWQIVIVLVITLVASRIRHIVLNRVDAKLDTTQLIWGKTTVRSIRKPAAALIWIVGILYSIEIFRIEHQVAILDALPSIRDVAVIAVLTWFVFRFMGIYESVYLESKSDLERSVDATTVRTTVKILRVVVIILGTLVAMQTLGLNIAGILAFGGIGGLAVGFAARETIANYFGALMIFMDRPFKIGETITSSDRDIEGTVMDIGWRQTVIQRFDSRTLYVPNSIFSTVAVRNMTRQSNRRIYEYIGVRYEDAKQLAAVIKDVEDMIRSHPEIDQEASVMVYFDRFAPSSLDFFIYCFSKTVVWAEYHAVKQDILFKAMEIIENHGAEIAFPTSTVHLFKGASSDAPATKGISDAQADRSDLTG